jgi:hypothetical protein
MKAFLYKHVRNLELVTSRKNGEIEYSVNVGYTCTVGNPVQPCRASSTNMKGNPVQHVGTPI